MTNAIEIQRLCYRTGGKFEIKDLDLHVPQGAIYDEDCSRLSLALSDLMSHDLAVDRATDHPAVVRLTPVETASYRVKVVMETCQKNPCRFGVAVLTPPAP